MSSSSSIQNTTWIIRTKTLQNQRAQIMFELAAYPGLYIQSENQIQRVSLLTNPNDASALFSTEFTNDVEFSIASDPTPMQYSFTRSSIAPLSYLTHIDNTVSLQQLQDTPNAQLRYDATWILTKSNFSNGVSITSLNAPGKILCENANSNSISLESSLGRDCDWRVTPGTHGLEIKFEAFDGNNVVIGYGEDQSAVSTYGQSVWTMQDPKSYPTFDYQVTPKLDFLIGKTVNLLFISRIYIMCRLNLQSTSIRKLFQSHSKILKKSLNQNYTGK